MIFKAFLSVVIMPNCIRSEELLKFQTTSLELAYEAMMYSSRREETVSQVESTLPIMQQYLCLSVCPEKIFHPGKCNLAYSVMFFPL